MRPVTLTVILTLGMLAVACSKSDSGKAPAKTEPPPPSSGNAFSGSGSAAAGSSATMAGSAGTMVGSAGSAVAMGSGAGSGGGMGILPGSDFDFDKLDHKAQAQFMKEHVVPPMKIAFQAFDAKKFANFDCKTCHGKDPKATKFKMPNPELPKLDFVAIRAGKQNPKMAEFMQKTVKPQMAKILNHPEYDPKTNVGFGCLDCHEQKGK